MVFRAQEDLPSVYFVVLVPDCVKAFVLIGVLEGPSIRHKGVVKNIGLFRIEAASLHNFADTSHSIVLIASLLFGLCRARWVKKARAYKVFAQLYFLFDELG